jgi:adenosylcobinamide-phosphate synthase
MVTAARVRARRAAASLALDGLIGDDPLRPHPVALFGKLLVELERHLWRDSRLAGTCYAVGGVLAAGTVGFLVDLLPAGGVLGGYAVIAAKGLWAAAFEVEGALRRGDLDGARALVRSLVGRDTALLDEVEIARAVVESVAENTVDAIVAPVVFVALGGGAGGFAYRAVNTLDSMVGHRCPRYLRFGWASARLDDLVNFVPARLSALLVACLNPAMALELWRVARADGRAHPSPNAGLAEAAFAVVLGVRLGGPTSYGGQLEDRPILNGAGRDVVTNDINVAVSLSRRVSLLLWVLLAAGALRGRSARAGPRIRPESRSSPGGVKPAVDVDDLARRLREPIGEQRHACTRHRL